MSIGRADTPPLVIRPWMANTYLLSKISYRCGVINLRSSDIKKIQASIKKWISQGLVQRPNEVLLFRPPELGGLGLTNVYARATANLVKNFVEMGLRESKCASLYINAIFRASPEVFTIVKEAMQDSNILLIRHK